MGSDGARVLEGRAGSRGRVTARARVISTLERAAEVQVLVLSMHIYAILFLTKKN